jgi:hypothetical protein
MKTKLLLLVLLCLLFSCKKKETENPVTSLVPLVKTMSNKTKVIGRYWYDNQGRMTCSAVADGSQTDSTVYTYGNNSIVRMFYLDDVLYEVENGTSENGHVTYMSGHKTDSSSYWSAYYTYDANGFLVREIHMDNDTVETWRAEYQIFNNNILTYTRLNYLPVVYLYDYYPGTTNSIGVLDKYGPNFGKWSTNLARSCTITYNSGTLVQYVSYEYFPNGWVKKLTGITGTDTTDIFFTYW